MKKNSRTLFHLHLGSAMGNKSTLICRLEEGSIRYIHYGGTGSSGTPYALSNIQFYKMENGNMRWLRNAALPLDNLNGESLNEFKARVVDMLNHSTDKVINEVSTNVTFA